MRIEAIIARYERMKRPEGPETLFVEPLHANAHLAVQSNGLPALFFSLSQTPEGTSRKVTQSLDAIYSDGFRVYKHDVPAPKTQPGVAIILRDLAKLWCFAAIVSRVASQLKQNIHCLDSAPLIESHLFSWIEFFTQEKMSPEKAIGLWGELQVLLMFPDTTKAVVSWVGPSAELFDFIGNGIRLEIKTTISRSTVHFNLAQLAGKDSGYTAHVRALRDSTAGTSIDDLVQAIRTRLDDDSDFVTKLSTIGFNPGEHDGLKLVLDSVSAAPNELIPRPVVADKRIRTVHFEVDFDGLESAFVPIRTILEQTSGHDQDRRS